MKKARKTWSAEEKMSIVLENIKGNAGMSQLSKDYGVHESQLYKWKNVFIDQGLSGLRGTSREKSEPLAAENKRLKELVGEQTLQIQLLKKINEL